MGEKIQSKVFNYGNEKEASWPPRFPPKRNSGRFYWDNKAQEFKEGNPPNPNNNFGEAPQVIFDNMKPQYHAGECREITSIKEWDSADKQHGLLTFTNHEEARRKAKRGIENEKIETKKDRRKSVKAALESWKSNPREQRQKLQKQGEKQIETAKKIGLDLSKSGIKIKE